MNEFKLLAIRPLSEDHCKNLNVGSIYQFYHNYKFNIDDEKEVISIIKDDKLDSLYNSFNDEVNINISAIVGKNGSGKSSLLELFFAFCYILAKKKRLLNIDKNENTNYGLLNTFKIEIYFEINNNIYKIFYNSDRVYQRIFSDNKWKTAKYIDNTFFYSIAINYSLYGLNSKSNRWLNHLFHKNDGYQTPLVINPFREEGIININSEFHLAQSRLLANISSYLDENPKIIGDKEIDGINFEINPIHLSYVRDNSNNKFTFSELVEEFNSKNYPKYNSIINFVEDLYTKISGSHFSKNEIDYFKNMIDMDLLDNEREYRYSNNISTSINNEVLRYYFFKYIIRKVFKICIKYPEYSEQHLLYEEEKEKDKDKVSVPKIINPLILINKLNKDKSHLTLKLRQAIFMLKFDFFKKTNIKVQKSLEQPKYFTLKLYQSFIDYKELIKKNFKENNNYVREKIEVIPGALVRPNIKIKGNDSFNELSSGEQQYLHTFHTVIYHLYNLNSVFKSNIENTNKSKYENVNIILDEIELYFHPEFQRNFIIELLNGIRKMNFNKIKSINMLFSTHSPFILSDIPHTNILKLEDGNSEKYNDTNKTFGANIHDLLHNDFFMKDGFMGKFAEKIIKDTIEWLNNKTRDKDLKEQHKHIISLVAEPILRLKLIDMFDKIYLDDKKNRLIKEVEKMGGTVKFDTK